LKKTSAILILILILLVWFKYFYSESSNDNLPESDFLTGKVIKIADGDTFTLLTSEKEKIRVRLHGIDCPERKQSYSKQATQFLKLKIKGEYVKVKITDTDRYGRTIGVVYFEEQNINEAMLTKGFAWHYAQYDNNKKWAKLEREARKKGIGIWSQQTPTPPWEWRKANR